MPELGDCYRVLHPFDSGGEIIAPGTVIVFWRQTYSHYDGVRFFYFASYDELFAEPLSDAEILAMRDDRSVPIARVHTLEEPDHTAQVEAGTQLAWEKLERIDPAELAPKFDPERTNLVRVYEARLAKLREEVQRRCDAEKE